MDEEVDPIDCLSIENVSIPSLKEEQEFESEKISPARPSEESDTFGSYKLHK